MPIFLSVKFVYHKYSYALIAQLVEQLICNHQVRGSSPRGGTRIKRAWYNGITLAFQADDTGSIPVARSRIYQRSSAAEQEAHNLEVIGSSPIVWYQIWGISSFGRASDLHSEGERFDPAILHQYRLPLLNPEKLCGNNLQYISSHGKIQRPDVMYQGTL